MIFVMFFIFEFMFAAMPRMRLAGLGTQGYLTRPDIPDSRIHHVVNCTGQDAAEMGANEWQCSYQISLIQ